MGWCQRKSCTGLRALVDLTIPAHIFHNYLFPAHNTGPYFSTLQRCFRVSSPALEQLFGFPGFSIVLDCYLGFGWCSSACQQGLLPPCLAQLLQALLGCTPAVWAQLPCTVPALGPSTLPLRACTERWQWAQSWRLAPSPCCPPELPLPHTTPTLPHWLSKGIRVSLSDVVNTPSLLAFRKGLRWRHLLYGDSGCPWATNPYNRRRLRRHWYGWCARSAQIG